MNAECKGRVINLRWFQRDGLRQGYRNLTGRDPFSWAMFITDDSGPHLQTQF